MESNIRVEQSSYKMNSVETVETDWWRGLSVSGKVNKSIDKRE